MQGVLKKILARLFDNSDRDNFYKYPNRNQYYTQGGYAFELEGYDKNTKQTNRVADSYKRFNWGCAWDCARLLGINNFNENLFLGYNALRWFKYALHTEIQLALLIRSGMKLVPHSPILSLKDPCPSCEQGANSAWDHQDHKFFSIQGDSQGDNHEFSTRDGTIIKTRYCTWK